MPWAIKWRSENRLDGKRYHLIGRASLATPSYLRGYKVLTFETRIEAREHIKRHFGYITERKDLRREPHGWRLPIPVKVTVVVDEAI